MLPIILPSRPRRALLRSFWLALSVSMGLFMGVLASLLISPLFLGLAAIFAIVFAIPGLLWPQQVVVKPYKVFNKIAHYYARGMRLLLLGVCFYITFWGIGRTGSALNLEHPIPNTSLWVSRKTLPSSTYGSQWGGPRKETGEEGWIRHFLSWALHSGKPWTIFLLPFLILLTPLEREAEIAFPSNIYTLF